MTYWVQIEVINPTDKAHVFVIPKGRMISPKNIHTNAKVQNLVVTADTTANVPPNGKVIVTVPTQCTDPHYPAPNNTIMDITTFGQTQRPNPNVLRGRSM